MAANLDIFFSRKGAKNKYMIANSAEALENFAALRDTNAVSFIFESIMHPDYYYTIKEPSVAEFKDRGSKFIAYAYPVADVMEFKEKLSAIKKEHPKASHYCFAYRIGLDGTVYRVSDAGEPSGTAGRPILGQIDSKQLTNVLIIVVRYFGGTLLGVPGLINAYKSVAALALQLTDIVQKAVLIHYRLQFDYTQMNEVMKIVKQFDCVMLKQEMQLFCSMEIGVPKNRLEEVMNKLNDLRGVELEKF
jgi:uncharacterized YigZ family protein